MVNDAENTQRKLVRAYHRFFNSEEGQLVIADLNKTFRYALPALVPNGEGGIDPNQLLYADGQRSVICYIHQIRAQMPLDDEEENPQQPTVKK